MPECSQFDRLIQLLKQEVEIIMLKSKLIFALIIGFLLNATIGIAIGAPSVKKLPPLTLAGPTKVLIDTYLFEISVISI
jgi:hypothetical protein